MRRLAPLAVLLLATACGNDLPPRLPPLPGPLQRGPQVALVGPDEATLAWRTDVPGLGGVEYGETGALGRSAARPEPARDHVFRLTGLAPGTTYHYRLLMDGAVVSEGHRFRTASADPGAPVRFVALGDSGLGAGAQLEVAERIAQADPDLVLHTGDAIYERGAPSELDPVYFLPYRDLLDRIPFYLCLGNHDTYFDGGRTLLDAVHLPVNDATGTEAFYSFDRGEVHFVALDSNGDLQPGSPQHAWLADDLAATGARWRVVFFHHPPYSSGVQGNDPALRAAVCPLFEQHAVDLVFNGHDHIYHRSLPVRDGAVVASAQEPDFTDPDAPVYIVTGGGGKSLHGTTARPFTARHEAAFHFVLVEIDGGRLALTAVRADGTALDRMTLTKGGP